ncbi:hypothetical protein BH23GEM9_BH23GEM9_29510 [soil metagenome]
MRSSRLGTPAESIIHDPFCSLSIFRNRQAIPFADRISGRSIRWKCRCGMEFPELPTRPSTSPVRTPRDTASLQVRVERGDRFTFDNDIVAGQRANVLSSRTRRPDRGCGQGEYQIDSPSIGPIRADCGNPSVEDRMDLLAPAEKRIRRLRPEQVAQETAFVWKSTTRTYSYEVVGVALSQIVGAVAGHAMRRSVQRSPLAAQRCSNDDIRHDFATTAFFPPDAISDQLRAVAGATTPTLPLMSLRNTCLKLHPACCIRTPSVVSWTRCGRSLLLVQ